MSLSIALPSANQGLQAYQQIKTRGDPANPAVEARALLRAEQEAAGTVTTQELEVPETEQTMTRQELLELQRSWGLKSAFLGTQVDVFV
ncbi:hypothetical protein H8K35_15860 [Undibacterium sp. LX40W]|uniref:Uncharacterized protein n=1 Tax=Undibacterium nitidum TaxID=2762298 RepID=A0A923KMG6_9BURK|nr:MULTISPECIES: hypothetical protein [Undibacterium]MBC3882870.1 hypothetical protein [Undibacterium nitidum]MBC3893151.1 hypothetical protein [Undibacterium sp. LX40W]